MADHAEQTLLSELDEEGVLLLTLNRPEKKNSFREREWDQLARALDEASEDPSVAVVVLTGAGGVFSSGVDLGSFGEPREPREDGKPSGFFACVDAIFGCTKPLLAAVEGVAVGGGATIPMAADFAYAGDGLRMRLPFANLGLVPEFASSYVLQMNVGRQRANELMFTAEWIDAQRALDLGLVARVVPEGEALTALMEKAHEIARWPVSSLAAIKKTMQRAHLSHVADAREVEDAEMMRLAGSPENIEAVTAFMQKRDPDFKQFRKK